MAAKKKNPHGVKEGHTNWAEHADALYKIYESFEEPTAAAMARAWTEKNPDIPLGVTYGQRLVQRFSFNARLYMSSPEKLNPYMKDAERVKALSMVARSEAANATPEFVKGIQGAIFTKLMEDLQLIKVDTPEKAVIMVSLAGDLVKIEHQKRGIGVAEREEETSAQTHNDVDWSETFTSTKVN